MQIGLDGVIFGSDRGGTYVYFSELVRRLSREDRSNQYRVFLARSIYEQLFAGENLPRTEWQMTPPTFLPRALFHQLYYAARRLTQIELLHTAAFLPPLLTARDVPSVVTLHDLNFWEHPETMKGTGLLWWRVFGRRGIARATRIIAVSESTKQALGRYMPGQETKTRVVHTCLRYGFGHVENPRERLARYRLPEKYVLFVGTLEPRKNIANLIQGFAQARREGNLDHRLVVAGAKGWESENIQQMITRSGLEGAIHFLGYVPDSDLPSLYSAADLFVYVSWYEGFGLPLLEAMACGTPVITSNLSSMPEVVGEAGILVDPSRPAEIASRIVEVLTDRGLHDELIRRGRLRAQAFSPARFVQEILSVYQEAVRPA